MNHHVTIEQIKAYGQQLSGEERCAGTVEKYMRDTRAFLRWLDDKPVTKEQAAEWKAYLLTQGYAPVTINAMLSALNGLFRFLGWDSCSVKFLKIQRRVFSGNHTRAVARRIQATA